MVVKKKTVNKKSVEKNFGRKFSILSIVFAVLSLVVLPIIFGPLGVIFGIIAVIKGDIKLGVLGIVLSVILALISTVIAVIILSKNAEDIVTTGNAVLTVLIKASITLNTIPKTQSLI